jgi:glycosidase
MSNIDAILSSDHPQTLKAALDKWPQRDAYTHSPSDWRDQVFYFLLPDRFSNGNEKNDRLLDSDLSTAAGLAKIRGLRGSGWNWDKWQTSGGSRFQGGTLQGVQSKLSYLTDLGVTALWIGPVFRQRVELDTYHGYGIQDFLDVDARFGTRKDLVQLVDAAHKAGLLVILDVIFNHSGCNWLYDPSTGNVFKPPYLPSGAYQPIRPRNGFGAAIGNPAQALSKDDYVWPTDLQGLDRYLRAGNGSLGAGDINDDNAEHKRTDFENLRKFNLFADDTLYALMLAYHYWIALADLDGFRIDTFKHVTQEQARNFCNAIKEYAEVLGKDDFLLVAEVAGGNSAEDRYLDITGRNLNACLDIGEQREIICNVGKGLDSPGDFFTGFNYYDAGMGSHRNYGSQHMSISNDHDHVFGSKVRFAADESNDHQAATIAAVQLFTLGMPCVYYGTEQGLASGAERDQRQWLQNWGGTDTLLREAMFGPEHPRASGWGGTQGSLDNGLPGFGPHGTAGWHVFNPNHPVYKRMAVLTRVRQQLKPLRRGRQYQRPISFLSSSFGYYGGGEIMAWSRIYDDQEVLVVVNAHGDQARGARIVVDGRLSSEGMQVVANTDPSAAADITPGAGIALESLDYWRYLRLDKSLLAASEVMVLANRSAIEAAGLKWHS